MITSQQRVLARGVESTEPLSTCGCLAAALQETLGVAKTVIPD